jgi:hypothetical protein
MKIERLARLHGREKLEYIADHLDRHGDQGPCEIKEYRRGGQTFHNLYAPIASEDMNTTSVALTAHHDVVNRSSDNCLDNTASVYNLAMIHNALMARGTNRDIVIAFTDAEETCNATLNGVGEMLLTYDPDYHVDFELTASGGEIISTQYGRFDLFRYHDIVQPYNNAKVSWGLVKGLNLRLRGSSCVAMVSEDDLVQLRSKKYCRRWSQCHTLDDSFDRWLDPGAMETFRLDFINKFAMPQIDVLTNQGDSGHESEEDCRGLRPQVPH